ncbi:MAG TPA: glycosyltransferase family 39 protein [Terriglobales bacterium]|nr:glycosyltransferase family 39 protein [Terriglobales bacterium]
MTRGTRPVPAWAWAAVLAFALAVRLAVVWFSPRVILWADGRDFEALGRFLLTHHGYGMDTVRPPGYPTFIAAVYALFGTSLLALRIVEAILAAVFVGVVAAVGMSLFGPWAGLVSAALASLEPILVLLPATQYSENLLLLLVVLAFAASFAAWRRGALWRWVLAGALFGLVILTRPNVTTLLPGFVVGFALALRRERKDWVGPLLAAAVAAALVISPWIVRNYRVHHRWYFVASTSGRLLWLGNNPGTTGATNVNAPFDSTLKQELLRQHDDLSADRVLLRHGLTFMREHPGRAAWLYLLKLRNLFALYPDPITRTPYQTAWSLVAQALASSTVFAGALLALGRLRASPALWPMLGGVLTYALVSAVFLMVMRYRMAIEPFLLWMAGLGWADLLGRARPELSASAGSAAA